MAKPPTPTPNLDAYARHAGAYVASANDTAARLYTQTAVLHTLGLNQLQAATATQQARASRTLAALHALAQQLLVSAAPQAAAEYWHDLAQRAVLFTETLYRRGNACLAREAEGFKPVLAFDYDMIVDGRELARPVNYALVQIRPPADFPPQRADGRPWLIIDPRAGHGSGIGGFKAESEVGVALRDGHPVYFVIFFPDPEPAQTLADVCAAEAAFLREVRLRHPAGPKPLITGNCQGGWAAMILAATHPELMGPLVIAGAPLSYWSGDKGGGPFRYLGGVAGGAVPALLASDLGGGIFDGADLVQSFEQLNPSRTYWRKAYDVFADVDTEAERFLEFERWWSGFYFMNEAEIRWIVENLFIGNRLTRGQAHLDDGTPVDLTRIQVPVIVFASHGDNITPPQQALNWIPDLYASEGEIQARGQVIIYALHDSVGHLGIFVSAKVASEQHKQITSVVKTIESLAPGLYEMRIVEAADGIQVSFEARTMADLLALDDGREEEAAFAAMAEVSEWLTKTYELTWRPLIRAWVTPALADQRRQLHPLRQQRYLFSERNPFLAGIAEMAASARDARAPAASDNPFVLLERLQADLLEHGLDAFRDARDAMIEFAFHAVYGTPWMTGLRAPDPRITAARKEIKQNNDLADMRATMGAVDEGGYPEAIVRMLTLMARARGAVHRDLLERFNAMLDSRPPFDTMPADRRRDMIHRQTVIGAFAGEEAITSLPKLLRDDVDCVRAVNLVLDLVGPVEAMDEASIVMFRRLQFTLRTMAKNWHDPGSAPRTPHTTADVEAPNAAMPDAAAAEHRDRAEGVLDRIGHLWTRADR